MYLYRFHGYIHRYLAGVQFGHGPAHIVVVALVFVPSSFHHQMAGCLYAGVHIGQFKGDGLVVADFGAKSLAHFAVFTRQIVGSSGNSQSLCGNADTATGKGFHGKGKAETVFANAVFLRNLYIIEYQGMGVTATDAQFVFLWANLKTFPAFFNNKGVDAVVFFLLVGLGDDQIIIGRSSVGNPVFGTVKHIMVAFVNGRSAL